MKKLLTVFLLTLIASYVAGCGGSSDNTSPQKAKNLTIKVLDLK